MKKLDDIDLVRPMMPTMYIHFRHNYDLQTYNDLLISKLDTQRTRL